MEKFRQGRRHRRVGGEREGVHRTVGYDANPEKGTFTRRVSYECEIPLRAVGLLRPVYDNSTGTYGLCIGDLACGEELMGLGVRVLPMSKKVVEQVMDIVLPNPAGFDFEADGTLTVRLLTNPSRREDGK